MTDEEQTNGESVFVYEVSPAESLSEGVIEAVATAADADRVPTAPEAIEKGDALAPLSTAVDPDALDAVFRTTERPCQITFAYHGREVTVENEGRVTVRKTTEVPGELAAEL